MRDATNIPMRDLFRNPEKVDFQISPDGKHLAFLAPVNGRLNVHVQDLASMEIRVLTEQGVRNIAGIGFVNNERLLYVQDVGGDENWQVFVCALDGSDTRCLTPFPGVVSRLVDLLKDRDDEILISHNKRDPKGFDVYCCNIRSGEMQMVAQNPGNVTRWKTDHEGRVRVAVKTDGVNNVILYRDHENEDFREILRTDFRTSISPSAFSFDNQKLIMLSNKDRDTEAFVEYDPHTGVFGRVLFEHPEYDMEALIAFESRKSIVGAAYWSWKLEFLSDDPQLLRIIEALKAKLSAKMFRISDATRDESRMIICAFDDITPSNYYLYDVASETLTKLAESRPWLNSSELCEQKPVVYSARDGLSIHGYLTLPKSQEARDLPVIMYVHGGPWARDRCSFDPSIQLFANRGYAVMQMNFRGSTGYGRKFWEASFKQWGRAMQDDVSDAVEWLCDQGIADRKRVAIVGGSYGGYAVLAGLTLTPDTYCCGIDIVGVSNLFTFRKTVPEYWKPMNEMLDQMIGDPATEYDMLREVSPIFHADKIKVPLLVFQGAKDPRVNINESDQMVGALRERGIEVEYIVKEEEGHGFMNEENRLEMFNIIERFLAQHLS